MSFPAPPRTLAAAPDSPLDSHAPFRSAALLARADVTQAAFARLTGVTPRQVNNWCRGRGAVPAWAGVLAALLQDHSPEALAIVVEEAQHDLSSPKVANP